MATDARGHTVPAGSDAFDPQGSDVALSLSINDVVMAANATDLAAKVTALAPTAGRPAFLYQLDTGQLWVANGATTSLFNQPALAWYGQRGSQSATQSANEWFTGAVTIALPATAPAGQYRIDASLVMYIDAGTDTSIDRRVMWGTTEIQPTSSGNGVIDRAPGDVVRPVHLFAAHTGGAVTVSIDAKCTVGNWAIRAATEVAVQWIGA